MEWSFWHSIHIKNEMEVIGQKDKGHLRGQRSNYKKCSDWAQIYMEWSFWHSIHNKMKVIEQKGKGHLRGQRSIFQKCSNWAQIYMEWSLWHYKHIKNTTATSSPLACDISNLLIKKLKANISASWSTIASSSSYPAARRALGLVSDCFFLLLLLLLSATRIALARTCLHRFSWNLVKRIIDRKGTWGYDQFRVKGHVGVTGVKNVNCVKKLKQGEMEKLMVSSCWPRWKMKSIEW